MTAFAGRAPANRTRMRVLAAATLTALLAAGLVGFGVGGAGAGPRSAAPMGATATQQQFRVGATPGAAALQQQFVNVVAAVSPEVVQIQTQQGLGSGVVYDDRGDVVTNAHVVDGASKFLVTLSGGDQHSAIPVGVDRQDDLAVIRIQGATPAPATFADSSKVRVGDIALALGNPLGLRSSVTQGIVSSVGRNIPEGTGATIDSAIQTSAEINPGNSGGALVDLTGGVIGIPTLTATDPEFGNAQAPGIGFAIPSNTVQRVAGELIAAAGS